MPPVSWVSCQLIAARECVCRGHESLDHGAFPEFVLDGVWVVTIGGLKNLLEVAFGCPCLSLAIAFDHRHELLVRVLNFFPFFLPLEPFLVPLATILGDAVWLSMTDVPASIEVKVALTASSLKACQVLMSSNALVVFGCSRLSS
jgi:hypothetical protein